MIKMVKNKANVKNKHKLMFLGAWECRICNKKKFEKNPATPGYQLVN